MASDKRGKITTKPKPGKLVRLVRAPRAAYSTFEELSNGSENFTTVYPYDVVLFLANTRELRSGRFSSDCVLFGDRILYILNDYPRTEEWMEIT